MSGISTHVLDMVLGKPAAGIAVRLEQLSGDAFVELAKGVTDQDGRCRDLMHGDEGGVFRLTFEVSDYFSRQQRKSIYPQISVTFARDKSTSYHLPLLLSDNGYTTYRGS